MTNFQQNKYSETDYIALGHFLRREMFGVELNEDENILATMSVLKFPEIRIPKHELEFDEKQQIGIIVVEEKRGYITKEGWITLPIYDNAWTFDRCGLAAVMLVGKWGFINKKGEIVIDIIYDRVSSFFEEDIACVHLNGKAGFIDPENNLLFGGLIYYSTKPFSEGFAAVKLGDTQNGEWRGGWIDKQGKLWWVGEYSCWSFYDDFARVEFKNHQWGFIGKDGKLLGNKKYEYVYGFDDSGFASVTRAEDGKYGFIDKKGNWYDELPK